MDLNHSCQSTSLVPHPKPTPETCLYYSSPTGTKTWRIPFFCRLKLLPSRMIRSWCTGYTTLASQISFLRKMDLIESPSNFPSFFPQSLFKNSLNPCSTPKSMSKWIVTIGQSQSVYYIMLLRTIATGTLTFKNSPMYIIVKLIVSHWSHIFRAVTLSSPT